jgi:GNAT superfamily N-acetyltransferase
MTPPPGSQFRPTPAADLASFCTLAGLSALTPESVTRHQPAASWVVLEGDDVAGRCSLWWQNTPAYSGHRLGLIGHYAVRDADAAAAVLRLACEQLRVHGCTLAVGPVDGTTWNRYRLVTERGDEPMYFLEPDNPDDWPDHWLTAGFTPLSQYFSAVTTSLGEVDPRMPDIVRRMGEQGITVRPLDVSRFEEDLRRIHTLSLLSFKDNFLYSPITEADFLAQYLPLRPHVRPELVMLLEQGSELVGYLFGVPDLLQAKRGLPIDTTIIKTIAVHPRLLGQGLGVFVMGRFQQLSAELGYRRVIHALMQEDNRSRRISKHNARTIRRYTLYARPLT